MVRADGPSSKEDYTLMNELLESIENEPNNTESRWLLAQVYETFGWMDEAAELVRRILELLPGDESAFLWLSAFSQSRGLRRVPAAAQGLLSDSIQMQPTFPAPNQLPGGVKEMETCYRKLMSDAEELMEELHIFQQMASHLDMTNHIVDLKAMTEGRFCSVMKAQPPPSARRVAEKIKTGPADAVGTAFTDLEAYARWLRTQPSQQSGDLGEAVRKRALAIRAVLSNDLGRHVEIALMHMEHEALGKKYQNADDCTMYGDLISAIPRSNFWVTEDGYAWDMSELASAIKANQGAMRNPLSKAMFTEADVRAIVRHPHGKGLAALQLKQQQLIAGIRPETVSRLQTLAGVLLEDQEMDSAASRMAVDEFAAYCATLPDAENVALQDLRVPALDSHTGQAFDTSIGQAVADAKANKLCWHKTGDLLQQAAMYLHSKGSTRPHR